APHPRGWPPHPRSARGDGARARTRRRPRHWPRLLRGDRGPRGRGGLAGIPQAHPHPSVRQGARAQPPGGADPFAPHVPVEFVCCSITPRWAFTDAATIALCIKTIGPSRVLISSDGGQAHNPMPADGYRRFVELLHDEGIAAEDFRVMCRDNGDDLLHG